ncbi:hypothetical protein [Rubellicoccus peritrichatus]|uniref:Uncharacterized protein n=1 Tax=Rubellicoccus peritrichatus TaxID=3080537 RepID=A0AAQ3LDD9_9BACT|nr:hypothetical protein [Puniceicoccus sp. CR14]WOO41815.1 hypothetical protein RZN69_01850 [Puniceicoccus sp. CR14]
MPYLHLRKLYLGSKFLLPLIAGIIAFQAHISAEDIILKNGKVLENATIVGETNRTLIIQYDDGVKSFPLHLLPERYHPEVEEPVVATPAQPPADDVSADDPFAAMESQAASSDDLNSEGDGASSSNFEHFTSTERSNNTSDGFYRPVEESGHDFGNSFSDFLDYYLEGNRANGRALVAMVSEVPKSGLWVAAFAMIAVISVGTLITAIFFRIISAITKLPLSTYGKCYRVLWLSSVLAFIAGVLSAIYVPGLILWPWFALLVPLIIGGACAMVVYGQSPVHGAMSYFAFWLIGTALSLGLSYYAYSSGIPVTSDQEIESATDFLKARFGDEAESEESSD